MRIAFEKQKKAKNKTINIISIFASQTSGRIAPAKFSTCQVVSRFVLWPLSVSTPTMSKTAVDARNVADIVEFRNV